MELKTFGDGLQFGIELESASQSAYEQMAQTELQPASQEAMSSFARACKKRRSYLEALFKESIYSDMDTGVFEPIGCLDGNRYKVEQVALHGGEDDPLESIISSEEGMRLFYVDFATLIKSNRNAVAQKFIKMAEESSARISRLRQLKSRHVD